jgi:hypothetical protein
MTRLNILSSLFEPRLTETFMCIVWSETGIQFSGRCWGSGQVRNRSMGLRWSARAAGRAAGCAVAMMAVSVLSPIWVLLGWLFFEALVVAPLPMRERVDFCFQQKSG